MNFLYRMFVTSGGLGYIGPAPGTLGSLPGLALGVLLYRLGQEAPLAAALFFIGLCAFSLFAINQTQPFFRGDDPRIVIDETLGQALALAFVAPSVLFLSVGFVLFRILDISKPLFIGWADRNLKGAWGILVDDLFAGAVTGLVLFLLERCL